MENALVEALRRRAGFEGEEDNCSPAYSRAAFTSSTFSAAAVACLRMRVAHFCSRSSSSAERGEAVAPPLIMICSIARMWPSPAHV